VSSWANRVMSRALPAMMIAAATGPMPGVSSCPSTVKAKGAKSLSIFVSSTAMSATIPSMRASTRARRDR
jgi:hypothetical protein